VLSNDDTKIKTIFESTKHFWEYIRFDQLFVIRPFSFAFSNHSE